VQQPEGRGCQLHRSEKLTAGPDCRSGDKAQAVGGYTGIWRRHRQEASAEIIEDFLNQIPLTMRGCSALSWGP
jgi:hypothetical protein